MLILNTCSFQKKMLPSLKCVLTQLTFTFSKLTIETLEKSVKYVQSQQWKHENDVVYVVMVFYS